MNPITKSDTAAPKDIYQLAGSIVDEGEVVILVVKPAGWFTILTSMPVMIIATIITGAFMLVARVFEVPTPPELSIIVPICLVAVCLRIFWACSQWTGRLYVLTNRRVIRVNKGLLRTEVFSCPLKLIRSISLSVSFGERLTGLASIDFEIDQKPSIPSQWQCISNPADVERIIAETIGRDI